LSVGFLLTFSPRNEAGQAPLGQFFAFKFHDNTRTTNFEKVEDKCSGGSLPRSIAGQYVFKKNNFLR
jgi:hypothetical protein